MKNDPSSQRDVTVVIGGDVTESTIYAAGRDIIVPGAGALATLARPDLRHYLRVLVIIAAPVTGERETDRPPVPLDARAEWQNLARAVRESHAPIALIRLTPPTPDALRHALGPRAREQGYAPQVVHFIGHGERQGLWFEDEWGRARLWRRDKLVAAFRDSGVRLAVLNACHSATADGLSVAEALVREGAVEASIGHRRPVGDAAAVAFAATLYSELAAGGLPLGEAFERAVARLRREHPDDADNPRGFGAADLTLEAAGRGEPVIEDGRPKGSLPTVAVRFFGRGPELVRLSRHLGDPNRRAVVLTGIGGIGKSALAVEAAHRNGWRFPGGMTCVSARKMAEFRADVVLADLAHSLGLAQRPGDDPWAALHDHCARHPTLLIFDNLETAAKKQPRELARLVEFLKGFPLDAGSKALATLRPPLPQLEELPGAASLGLTRGLDDESAARYVLFLAEKPPVKGLAGDPDEAMWLGGRLSGHPKMLEIVVGTARRVGYKRAREMAEGLSGPLAERRDEIIEWSVELLGSEGRRVLPYLPLFPAASFTYDAVLAACGGEWAGAGLDQLRDSGLIDYREEADRYELHQTVMEWAEARCPLGHAEAHAARLRLAQHYRAWVDEHSGVEDYDALEFDRENILAALEWAYTAEDWDTIADLAYRFDFFLDTRGFWKVDKLWLGRAIEACEKLGSGRDRRRATLLHNLAAIEANQGRYDEARKLYQRSAEISERLGDQLGLAATKAMLGQIEKVEGNLAEAVRLWKEALSTLERLGSPNAATVRKWLEEVG